MAKTVKFVWTLHTSDYDIKTFSVSRGEIHLGYVDVEYYSGRIESRVVNPVCNDTDSQHVSSRKEANEYLWATHLEHTQK